MAERENENRNGKKADLQKKIQAKLDELASYIEGADYCFSEPKKFSFNWFCDLDEGHLEKNSKAAKSIRVGTELKSQIDDSLARCAEVKESRKGLGKGKVAELEATVAKLKAEVKQLKKILGTQVDENTSLRRELTDLKRLEGIRQAQWDDRKKVHQIGGK